MVDVKVTDLPDGKMTIDSIICKHGNKIGGNVTPYGMFCKEANCICEKKSKAASEHINSLISMFTL